ncbi:importin-5 [Nephila pilipes]|uniref:Importin-5 n=1 Tax=Nephila pilipes TaxID=299642 RepID=A0A8X6QCY7_NEPPI|nr:importin-5 [Nephila pilipes]
MNYLLLIHREDATVQELLYQKQRRIKQLVDLAAARGPEHQQGPKLMDFTVAQYHDFPTQDKLFQLLEVVTDDDVDIQEAELAAVLLRRVISGSFQEVFVKLPTDFQGRIKAQILHRLACNMNQNLKRKICDVASELAQNCIDEDGNNHWPEFLQYLFDSARSTDPFVREIALLMFASVPGVFGNQQSRYIDIIHEMLCQSLTDQSKKVRYVAVKAFCNFLLANEKESPVLKQFIDCVNLLIQFFGEELNSEGGEPEEILRFIVELVEACPQLFRAQLHMLLQLCLKGVTDQEQPENCQHLCLEVCVTLCEAAPAMMKKLASTYITTTMSIVLSMMTKIDDDPKWNFVEDDNADVDNDSTPVVAEAALDRLACALGGKTILPAIMSSLSQLLHSVIWKERYAGLMAISAIGEGCHKQMSVLLGQIVDEVLPFLSDQHIRVRYAACNALGQMAADFASVFQKKFHGKIIPALCAVLIDPTSRRVQAHAGAALVNFFEDCPKNILSPYLMNLADTLEKVLQASLTDFAEKGTKLVLEQTVVTLASLADCAQENFSDYYERFMPLLKHIIINANQPGLGMLRGKTIECVSLIGLAVGKEKFLSDASEVMDLLLKIQTASAPMADDDPQLTYLIAAWARICKILGKGFKPYLPYVMEPVLRAAAIKPEVAILDAEELKVVGNDEDWEFVNLGETQRNFGIRTSGLEEKATACQIVRVAASEILPYLLDSAKVRGDEYVRELWRYILPPLLNVMDSEPENEVLCEHMAAFAQCIEILNCQCLQPEDMSNLINLLNKNLTNHFELSAFRNERRKDEDYDEVVEESLLKQDDEDTYLLSKISEIMSTLFSIYKKDFFAYFDLLLPHFINLVEPSRPWTDRQWSFCVFADIAECCGPECARYQEYFLRPLRDSLVNESVDLRQTAAYTVGVLSQYGGPQFAEFCSECLPFLLTMINSPYSRSEENERATENAISAITKFFVFNNPFINMEQLLPAWITWLPVWEDEEEVKCIYSFLCTLLETNNPLLLGKDNCNIPRILQIIAETFHKHALEATSDLGKRIVTLVGEIQKNKELFSLCVNQLNPDQQEALSSAFAAQLHSRG